MVVIIIYEEKGLVLWEWHHFTEKGITKYKAWAIDPT